ncbi:hypothetical protein BDC45DRAFT_443931 [Circinella umbellata]|nr:hypothetical protein BDC45DRAFT_443931 [Circinella umbellata]
MAWNCSCRNKVPDSPPYQWPVTLAECTGREQKCQAKCTNQSTQQLCIEGCAKYFRCNRPGGPQSQLQVMDPNMTPKYDDPTSNATVLTCLSYNNNVFLSSLFLLATFVAVVMCV